MKQYIIFGILLFSKFFAHAQATFQNMELGFSVVNFSAEMQRASADQSFKIVGFNALFYNKPEFTNWVDKNGNNNLNRKQFTIPKISFRKNIYKNFIFNSGIQYQYSSVFSKDTLQNAFLFNSTASELAYVLDIKTKLVKVNLGLEYKWLKSEYFQASSGVQVSGLFQNLRNKSAGESWGCFSGGINKNNLNTNLKMVEGYMLNNYFTIKLHKKFHLGLDLALNLVDASVYNNVGMVYKW